MLGLLLLEKMLLFGCKYGQFGGILISLFLDYILLQIYIIYLCLGLRILFLFDLKVGNLYNLLMLKHCLTLKILLKLL